MKRRRATPVPAASVVAGRVLAAIVIAVVMAAVLLGIGWAAYGAHVPGRTALALVVTVVTGAASFCCLGYALTSFIRNEDAALPAATAITPPLYFISGVFVAVTVLPHWLADAGRSSRSGIWPGLDQDRQADIGADQPRACRRYEVFITRDSFALAVTPEHFRGDPKAER